MKYTHYIINELLEAIDTLVPLTQRQNDWFLSKINAVYNNGIDDATYVFQNIHEDVRPEVLEKMKR